MLAEPGNSADRPDSVPAWPARLGEERELRPRGHPVPGGGGRLHRRAGPARVDLRHLREVAPWGQPDTPARLLRLVRPPEGRRPLLRRPDGAQRAARERAGVRDGPDHRRGAAAAGWIRGRRASLLLERSLHGAPRPVDRQPPPGDRRLVRRLCLRLLPPGAAPPLGPGADRRSSGRPRGPQVLLRCRDRHGREHRANRR